MSSTNDKQEDIPNGPALAVLHRRWKHRELASHRAYVVALALTALGIVLCFPLVWRMLN